MFQTQKNPKPMRNYYKRKQNYTKRNSFIVETKLEEESKYIDLYKGMLGDEKLFPVMRIFNKEAKYLSDSINVYKFYFNELQYSLKQRPQTLHLAMAYFTQTIMRCPCLQK